MRRGDDESMNSNAEHADTADTTFKTFLRSLLPFRHKLGGSASSSPGLARLLGTLVAEREGHPLRIEVLLSPTAQPESRQYASLTEALLAEGVDVAPQPIFPPAPVGSAMDSILEDASRRYLHVRVDLAGLFVLLGHPAVARVEPRGSIRVFETIGEGSRS